MTSNSTDIQEGANFPDWLKTCSAVSVLSELADMLDLSDINIRRAPDRGVKIPEDLDARLSDIRSLSRRALEEDQPHCDYIVAITGMLSLLRYLRDSASPDFDEAFELFHTAKEKLGEKWGDPLNPFWQMFHVYLSWIHKDVVGMTPGYKATLSPYISESQPGFQRADIIPLTNFPEASSIAHDAFPIDPHDPDYLCMIGTALVRRFQMFHDRNDIDKAVDYGKKAISHSMSNPLRHAFHCHRLATFLINRFDYFKAISDADAAAQYHILAFQTITDTPASESFQDSLELQALSVLRRLMSVGAGHNRPLDQRVIQLDDFYVSVIRPISPVFLIIRSAFADFYQSSFLETGGSKPTHVHKIIEHCTKFLSNIPDSFSPELRLKCLDQLALAYQYRFEHSGAESDWNLHIEHLQALVRSLEDANLPGSWDTRELNLDDARRRLSLALIRRFSVSKDPSDLELANKLHQLTVQDLDPASWHPHDYLVPLVLDMPSGLERRDRGSLRNCLTELHQSLERIAELTGGPTLPSSRLTHAMCAYYDWVLTSNPDSAKSCIDTCRDLALLPGTGPDIQSRAAVMWGQLAFTQGLPECLDAFQIASNLFSEVSSLQLGNRLQETYGKTLGFFPSIHAMATAAAVDFGNRVDLAIEYYEQGLSTTYRQLLQLRREVQELERAHPTLAQRLAASSAKLLQLSNPDPTDSMSLDPATVSDERMEAAVEHRRVINEIRTKPGFDRLLLPLPYKELAVVATDGPVIMLSHAYANFAHALILLGADKVPVALGLPGVTQEAVDRFTRKLMTLLHRCNALRGTTDDNNSGRTGKPSKPLPPRGSINSGEFEEVLDWLWNGIVDPVFKELENNGVTTGRIWWCPSDVFTRFPLHAAAPIDSPYIQSYTHTLESLIKARNRTSSDLGTGEQVRMSVVGVSKYEGWSSLACVRDEVEVISHLAQHRASWLRLTKLEDEAAQVERVLDAIKFSHIAHLACHGKQDHDKPLESGLILHNGILTLERLLAEDLRSAQLVVLSACQTATGDEKNMNESIHLAGGFMAAGFKGAIGTLWSICDLDAPVVTKIVYETIMSDEGIDIRKSAEGLRKAVRYLREKGVAHERWVPFIHVGV